MYGEETQRISTEKQDLNTSIETHTHVENCIENSSDSTCSKPSTQSSDLSFNSPGLLSTHSLKSISNDLRGETDSSTDKLI